MKQIILSHLEVALQVFLGSFFTFLGASVASGGIQFTWPFLGALLATAGTAALKEVAAKFFPVTLGGRVGPTLLGARTK